MKPIIGILLVISVWVAASAQELDIEDPNLILVSENGGVFNKDSLLRVMEQGMFVFTIKSDETLPDGKRQLVIIPYDYEKEAREHYKNKEGFIEKWMGKEFTDFELADSNGELISLNSIKGKITVVNFWFIGCRPCQEEIPLLNELVAEYEDKGIEFLAFSFDGAEKMKSFLNRKEFAYRIIPESRSVIDALEVVAYPTHMILDAQGVIRMIMISFTSNTKQELADAIEEILDK